MVEQKSSSALAAPLHGAASMLRRVPGAGVASRAAQGALETVGAVSPRGRRLAVYTGAGVLGVAGVVEWPVALTGAAVAWLTQPRPARPGDGSEQAPTQVTRTAGEGPAPDTGTAPQRPPEDGTAALRSAEDTGSAGQASPQATGSAEEPPTETDKKSAEGRGKASKNKAGSTGPHGPTARPSRTSR
ncbi:hypothetical protein ABZV31_07005 [Streptomyces sp. NPDC005202]|uniref:hypothetical protein n=1 Tax=Streptomyces sp. NPDC005202 TaxID=3157021 RepID=UPI0033AC8A37